MSALHLVTGGDEHRRSALVADLVGPGAGQPAGHAPLRVVGWGSSVVLGAEAADRHVPPSWQRVVGAATALADALGLPSEVGEDLAGPLRASDLRALLGTAALLQDPAAPAAVLLVCPPEADAAHVLGLPARAARVLGALVPVLARWEVLVGPAGVGVLERPGPAVLDALREAAALLEALDARIATDAVLHHVPGPGLVESARTLDVQVVLALMGRTLDEVHDGPRPVPTLRATTRPADGSLGPGGTTGDDGAASPFVLSVPLPGLTAADVLLEREDDDLVLSVGRHRRVRRLGPLHRRCRVTGAGMRAGVLTIDLEPDDEVWPRARV